jgi:hypothetical protein
MEKILAIVLFFVNFFSSIALCFSQGKTIDGVLILGMIILSLFLMAVEMMSLSVIIPEKYQTKIKEKEETGTKI